MLNCLGSKIDGSDRVVVIEETAELQLERVVADTVALQARQANIEGKGEINLGHLVKNSLRMRPNWIVVGEVRGAEALMMLLALTSGHAGMATVHADNPKAALTRLKTLAGMANESPQEHVLTDLIVGAIQLVVHLQHDLTNGRRVVSSILEVSGKENEQLLANEIFSLRRGSPASLTGETNPFSNLKEFPGPDPVAAPTPAIRPYLAWTGTMPRCYWKLAEVGLDWERQIVMVEAAERNHYSGGK
jgi:Flp pilus assembly CpaF family ATPase